MSTDIKPRQPKGIPSGGEFAAHQFAADDVDSLSAAPAGAEDCAVESVPTAYEFSAWALPKAIASIEKANRRAERAGIEGRFAYEVDTYEQTRTVYGVKKVEERARLTLDRPSVQHDGWTFAGTLSWDEEVGLVSRMAPGQSLIERPDARICDACGQARQRNDTYVIVRDGEQLQVGSDCLKNFLGLRPQGLWMVDFEPETPGPDDGLGGGAGDWRNQRFDSEQALAFALVAADEHGWMSRSAATGSDTATADHVVMMLGNRFDREDERRHYEALRAKAADPKYVKEASELLDEAAGLTGDSEYEINLSTVAAAPSVSVRNLGLLVSAIAARRTRQAREDADSRKKNSKHVGTVGEKVADVPVEVLAVNRTEGAYGTTTIIEMVDDQGNVFKWFASGSKTVDRGDTFTMSGTIKDHGEWRGIPETQVTRAKLNPVPA